MVLIRKILKILFALVVVLTGYVFWPSTPDFTHFDPRMLAREDIASWKAQAEGKWFNLGWMDYQVLNEEFGFSHLASMRMAYYHTCAARAFAETGKGLPMDTALKYLQAYYAVAAKAVKSGTDPDAMARGEFFFWVEALSNKASILSLIQVSADQWAGLAGGDAKEYRMGAAHLVKAAYLYGTWGPSSSVEAEKHLTEGYQMLLEATRNYKAGTTESPKS